MEARRYRERRKAGLIVVPVTVHHTRRAEIEAMAAQMQKEERDEAGN
jgi:hypothetical protein